MTLKEGLVAELYDAMRKGDRLKVSVLRLLRSRIGYEEIEKQKELDDAAVLDLIVKEVRQRRESIEMFRQGRRQDLVDKEEAEMALLQQYLPAQLSVEELTDLARNLIKEMEANGPKDMGKVMGRLMPQVRGRAEGTAVNQVVRQLLERSGD